MSDLSLLFIVKGMFLTSAIVLGLLAGDARDAGHKIQAALFFVVVFLSCIASQMIKG